MKELSIEDKAKAYDMAIEELRGLLEGIHEEKCEIMEEDIIKIFPELKESEDESIRKNIISYLKSSTAVSPKAWIAWLENQGTSYTKRDVDDAYLKGVTDIKNEIEKQYEANYQIRKDIGTFIFNYRGDIKDRAKWMDYLGIKVSFVEKQGKQKETLCDKCKKTQPSHSCQDITALGRCALEKQGEQKPAWSEEDEAMWTEISDLLWEGYKQSDSKFSWDDIRNWVNTKLLKGRVQPQKQEWSEEDKNRFTNLISLVKCSKENDATKVGFIEFINKLKSLSLKTTWKPSDEQMEALLWCVAHLGGADHRVLGELYENLKKLKENEK